MKEGYKKCARCRIKKPFAEFCRHKTKNGFQSYCKKCGSEFYRLWKIKNKKHVKEAGIQWRLENIEKCRANAKNWRLTNPEKYKAMRKRQRLANPEKYKIANKCWRQENPEKHRMACERWRLANLEKRAATAKRWHLLHPESHRISGACWKKNHPEQYRKIQQAIYKKIHSTPKGMLDYRMSNGIGKALHGFKGGRHWETLVGYTVDELKKHLETRFVGGMSWDNMGKWHIDHSVPKSRFHYETAESPEFKVCWSLANLQPMWAEDNQSKHAKTMTEWKARQ